MDSALCDVAAAAVACVSVTPIVGAVDRAVAESASGGVTLWSSFTATLRAVVREPHRAIFRPEMRYVAAMYLLRGTNMYGGTYIAANLVRSHEQRVSKSMPTEKTIAVGATNTALALWKDTNLAKLLGDNKLPPPRVPPAALASWAVRDSVGMAVIFTLPPLLSKRLEEHTGLSLREAEVYAQVLCPLAIQPVLAPFHLCGFMLVYSPSQTVGERLAQLRAEVPGVTVLRWIRGIPPYCLGAVANTNIRYELRRVCGLSNASVVK